MTAKQEVKNVANMTTADLGLLTFDQQKILRETQHNLRAIQEELLRRSKEEEDNQYDGKESRS